MTKSPFVFLTAGGAKRVWWPCTIREPIDSEGADKGATEDKQLVVRFEIIDDAAYLEALRKGGSVGVLKRVVVDWRATDEHGNYVPVEDLWAVVELPYLKDGLMAGYRDCIGRGPEKN